LKSEEATGTACIGLGQNEWRKRFLECVRIVGKHLKHGQLDKMSAKK